MSIEYGNADTLAGDHRACRRNDDAVLNFTPDTERFLFTLFFFSANIGNDVSNHLRPVLKGLSGTGNRLIGGGYHFCRLEFLPGGQHGGIALDGAVGLYGNKASCGSQTLLLEIYYLHVLRIDFRHYHGNIRGPAVCAVVGYHRGFRFRIFLFNLFDLFLCHINGAENKIHLSGNLFHFVDIHNHDFLNRFRHGSGHFPSVTHGILISFACGSGTCSNCGHFKPGMILQQGYKTLSHHTCSA